MKNTMSEGISNKSPIKRYLLMGILFTIVCVGLWCIFLVGVDVISPFASILSGIIAVTCYILTIMTAVSNRKNLKTHISPVKIFAIVDMICCIVVTIYGVYDINTDTGIMSGLGGVIALIFVLPFLFGLLLIDFFIWLIIKKRDKKRNQAGEP